MKIWSTITRKERNVNEKQQQLAFLSYVLFSFTSNCEKLQWWSLILRSLPRGLRWYPELGQCVAGWFISRKKLKDNHILEVSITLHGNCLAGNLFIYKYAHRYWSSDKYRCAHSAQRHVYNNEKVSSPPIRGWFHKECCSYRLGYDVVMKKNEGPGSVA